MHYLGFLNGLRHVSYLTYMLRSVADTRNVVQTVHILMLWCNLEPCMVFCLSVPCGRPDLHASRDENLENVTFSDQLYILVRIRQMRAATQLYISPP